MNEVLTYTFPTRMTEFLLANLEEGNENALDHELFALYLAHLRVFDSFYL